MAKYLNSLPSEAMKIPERELSDVARDSHAVSQDAKDAGVYVFGGGINEDVAPVCISGDSEVSTELYPESKNLNGGFTVLELATREEAVAWAAKIAAACRCAQEMREFGYDPMS